MLNKISLNIGVAILSVIVILSMLWNHYSYSATYTLFDWISIALLILIVVLALYKEYRNSR